MPILEVNLRAIDHNIARLKERLEPEVRLMPVIKADAYGLGACRLGAHLASLGATHLVVFSSEEASLILDSGFASTLIVLEPVRNIAHGEGIRRGLSMGRVQLVVHDQAHLNDLVGIAENYRLKLDLQLKIDTGLARGGCSPIEAGHVLERILDHPLLRICGVMTHFADAAASEHETRLQADRFTKWLENHRDKLPEDVILHAANTAGAHRSSDFHFDAIRVGLAWTGSSGMQGYQPVARVVARIIQVKNICAGQPVGYGGRWSPRVDTTIGLVDIGYANGLPSDFSKLDVPLRIWTGDRWEEAPVVGAVSMDQLTIDLGPPETRSFAPRPGMMIEVISSDPSAPNALHKIARLANKPPHEFLCSIGATSPRHYVRESSTKIFDDKFIGAGGR